MVRGCFSFPWPELKPGLFLEAKPNDFRPKAILTLLATVEVMDLWSVGEIGKF